MALYLLLGQLLISCLLWYIYLCMWWRYYWCFGFCQVRTRSENI